jgi:hypothetical protein
VFSIDPSPAVAVALPAQLRNQGTLRLVALSISSSSALVCWEDPSYSGAHHEGL